MGGINQCSVIFRGASKYRVFSVSQESVLSKITAMHSIGKEVLLISLIVIVANASGNEQNDCVNSDSPTVCRGVNFVSKAFNQIISNQHDETLKLLPGLEIVQNENINNVNDERSMPEQANETFLTRLGKYLQTHDLKIKFADMVGKTDLQEVINNVFNNDDPAIVGEKKTKSNLSYQSHLTCYRLHNFFRC